MSELTRTVSVTLEATGAWEVWSVNIPADVPESDALEYVKENLSDLEKSMDESGADHYEITEVEEL